MDLFEELRNQMVEQQLRARGIKDERVLSAMLQVPRHEFVSLEFQHKAYGDYPVPIGKGQTVSQPYIVAAMTEFLALTGSEKVLEIGTGAGYQAAVLSLLADCVFTVERHRALADVARENLQRLDYTNVEVLVGDGTLGLGEHAPYDGIIVAAAAPRVPPALLQQLATPGRMIIPIGDFEAQHLHLVRKVVDGLKTTVLEGCRFVPLLGAEGFSQP